MKYHCVGRWFCLPKESPHGEKNVFLWALPELPLPPPQFGQLVPLFLDVKNDVLVRITEPGNVDYDNDGSDNCDHNFGTFGEFGVKNDQKVSHNMILMSKYKGHGVRMYIEYMLEYLGTS